MGSWKEHNSSTGGYYNCNKFDEKAKEGKTDAQKLQETAKYELNRYIFYFERYNNHFRSERLARELRPVIQLKIK